jgi:hypothetical protein
MHSAPSPQGISKQLVHVSDFRAAIEHPLQSLEAPALYAHLLGMRQRPIIPQRPQSERKTPAQMSMELVTSGMTNRFPAADNFTLRNLEPFRPEASRAGMQDRTCERARTRDHPGGNLPEGTAFHPDRVLSQAA